MRSLGAIVVGIGAYQLDSGQFPRLQYPANDASEFAKYLAVCWSKPGEAQVHVVEEARATRQAVEEAARALARNGPFDLLLVFLSGHGLAETGEAHGGVLASTGFVLQPAPGTTQPDFLTAGDLDRLLGMVTATQCVLILDCCFAEGIVRDMGYFFRLEASDARLFIASSRADQRTWEDDGVQHGIFSAYLLDLLHSGDSIQLGGVRDRLDVDGELFPVLCNQVPLYVYAQKRQRQEPVKGGISIRPVTLPVARFARRFKERTAFSTALRRLRQIAVAALLTGVAALSLAYTLTYYAEIDRNAQVRLRHGLKWLEPVLGQWPDDRLETGIRAADLSDDPGRRYLLQAGELNGIWTHVARQGYRAWYDALRPSLAPRAAIRYDVLIAAAQTPPSALLDDQSRPADIALAAWSLLDHAEAGQLERVLSRVLGADRTAPLVTPINRQEMDFSVLDRSLEDLEYFAEALRFAAMIDPERTFTAYVGFLKACSLWLIHSTPEQRGRETQRRLAEEVVGVLQTLANVRRDRGESLALAPQMVAVLEALGAAGYDPLARLALHRVLAVTGQLPAAFVNEILAGFHGDPREASQAEALGLLRAGLDGSPQALRIVQTVHQRFVQAGQPEHTHLTAFLITAAQKRSLPPVVIGWLLGKARQALARDSDEFMDSEYARILSHGLGQLMQDSQTLVYQLVERIHARRPPMSSAMAEIYVALAGQRLETNAMFKWIVERASAAKPYQPTQVELPLPGLQIVVGPGPWLYALAILGSQRELPTEAVNVLEQHAADPALRDVIVRALLHQPAWLAHRCWEVGCRRVLADHERLSAQRGLMVDIVAEALGKVPRVVFLQAMQALDAERQREREPELRIALGQIRVTAQQARVRLSRLDGMAFE